MKSTEEDIAALVKRMVLTGEDVDKLAQRSRAELAAAPGAKPRRASAHVPLWVVSVLHDSSNSCCKHCWCRKCVWPRNSQQNKAVLAVEAHAGKR